MQENATVNAYLRSKVMSASPEELRLMLLDGALRFASQARHGLVEKDPEAAFAGFTQCRDIVLELLTSVRAEHDPQLAERVRALYSFMYSELVTASLDRDVPRLDKTIALLQYERDTWVMLMDQLARERATTEPKPAPPAEAPRAPLSVQA